MARSQKQPQPSNWMLKDAFWFGPGHGNPIACRLRKMRSGIHRPDPEIVASGSRMDDFGNWREGLALGGRVLSLHTPTAWIEAHLYRDEAELILKAASDHSFIRSRGGRGACEDPQTEVGVVFLTTAPRHQVLTKGSALFGRCGIVLSGDAITLVRQNLAITLEMPSVGLMKVLRDDIARRLETFPKARTKSAISNAPGIADRNGGAAEHQASA